jgi:tripartite-type tricarboxylate transporter receptor subunit TctC
MHSALRRALFAASLLACFTSTASAQTYPNRPITLVVTQGVGSGSDVTARLLAGYLGPLLGQTVAVENRAGASGIIGHQSVASARSQTATRCCLPRRLALFVVPVMNPNAKLRPGRLHRRWHP